MSIHSTPPAPYRILLRRMGAFGDVLDTTPIAERLRAENPDAIIHVLTEHPSAYQNNPHVDKVVVGNFAELYPPGHVLHYDRFIDLDMAYECLLRRVHNIDAYSEVAFGDRKTLKRITYKWPKANFYGDWSKAIVIHPTVSWPQRTMPKKWWVTLAGELMTKDWEVISIGASQDYHGIGTTDLVDKLDTPGQVAAIDAAAAYIGSDCGLAVLAQATNTPVVALLTMTLPHLCQHERQDQMGWGYFPILSDVPCVGCSAELDAPTTDFRCRYGDNRCVTKFDAAHVARVAEQAAAWGAEQRKARAA